MRIGLAAALWTVVLAPAQTVDLLAAERNYQWHCAFCHGRGDDGMAANLKSPRLPHAPSDAALFQVIKNGIPGTDMPPAIGMTDDEIRGLVVYVRNLGRTAPERVAGDARRGEDLFWGTRGNCGSCHMVSGRGGRQAPDLTDIGAKRSPANLRQSLVEPEESIAGGFLLVQLATRDGRKITGLRLNENTFSIQVRDLQDKIHSLRKSDLTDLKKETGKSTMPSYRNLSAQELDDLVAYLYSLKGGL
jgi:putative heme-binding domain-containing protein